MRIRTLYTFFLLTWVAIGYLTPVTAQNTAESPTETDYFEQITLFSDGRITRFTRMPIRVHISPTLKALPLSRRDPLRNAHLGNRHRQKNPF